MSAYSRARPSGHWYDYSTSTTYVDALGVTRDGVVKAAELEQWDKAVFELKGQLFNVKEYGALGDTTTDDTAAITAAITAMPAQTSYGGSGVLFFPPGDYRHTGITLPANKRIHMTGCGAAVSTLRLKDSVNGDSVTTAARSGGTDGWWHEISHLQIDGNKAGSNTTGHGITNLTTRTMVHHVHVTNCAQDGIHSDPASFALSSSGNAYHNVYLVSNGRHGLYLGLQGYDPFLTDIFAYLNGSDGINSATTNVFAKGVHAANNSGNGISLVGTSGGYGMWENVYAHLNTLRGISIAGTGETGHRFCNSQLIGNGTGGIYISTTNGRIGLIGSLVKDNTGPGAEIASCSFNIIDGCQFLDFQGSKTQTYGIVTTGTAGNNIFAGNLCRSADHLTGGMSLANTNDTIIGTPGSGQASTFQDRIQANQGITNLTVAGTPSDGSFTLTPPNGTQAADSNAAKLWVRFGGTWKGSPTFIGNPVTSKTANYTASTNDDVILGDAASVGAFQVTLPSATGTNGRRYTVKKTDSGGNAVTVGTTSSQTIDGSTTYALSAQWKYVTVCSDGTNWKIVANN